LALHIISRYCSPGEALKIAKVYLLKWHGEGQLPYASLLTNLPHEDAVVKISENLLAENFQDSGLIQKLISEIDIPERTLKRRFKKATGTSLIERIQFLRIEEAKKLLETESTPVDEISIEVGYEDPSFFRRLFKRLTGLTPSHYRRMFQPVQNA
jgi:transcriptional regulator GlxA family with amidase domain